jgi:hypothetical protein
MNRKIILGIILMLIGLLDLARFLSGYKSNTFTPPLVGFGILCLGGIYLVIEGRKEKR